MNPLIFLNSLEIFRNFLELKKKKYRLRKKRFLEHDIKSFYKNLCKISNVSFILKNFEIQIQKRIKKWDDVYGFRKINEFIRNKNKEEISWLYIGQLLFLKIC